MDRVWRAASAWFAIGIAMAVAACGATRPTDTVEAHFDRPEVENARLRAPDLYEQAVAAQRLVATAEADEDTEAAADHATRARLLLAASVAEADRIALEEQRLAAEASAREAEEQAARDRRARLSVESETGRRRAAKVAAEQAALAFQQAVDDEARRYRARTGERAELRRDAARVLVRRAKLIVAAAETLGADADEVNRASSLIEESERSREPAVALRTAERALRAALSAVGSARARREGPTPEEHQALLEAAREARFEVEQLDRGVLVRLPALFGSGVRWARGANARLGRLAAILRAHPHGVVQIHAYGSSGNLRARRRLAERRATSLANKLVQSGVPADRVISAGRTEEVSTERLHVGEVVLLAYGPQPEQETSAAP